METTLKVNGMHCPKCVARVKKGLEAVEGVDEAIVDLDAASAVVRSIDGVTRETLVAAVAAAGDFTAE